MGTVIRRTSIVSPRGGSVECVIFALLVGKCLDVVSGEGVGTSLLGAWSIPCSKPLNFDVGSSSNRIGSDRKLPFTLWRGDFWGGEWYAVGWRALLLYLFIFSVESASFCDTRPAPPMAFFSLPSL